MDRSLRAATEIGIARARANGITVVALRNAHHIGRIGTYGEICAEAGLVSIHFVNITDQRPTVAPWRGGDARFGTNPVCVAIPAAERGRPIILDMATSVIALGQGSRRTRQRPDARPRYLAGCPQATDHGSGRDVSTAARRIDAFRRAQGLRTRVDPAKSSAERSPAAPCGRKARARERRQRHADHHHRPVTSHRSHMTVR